jgi:hypothetical protein
VVRPRAAAADVATTEQGHTGHRPSRRGCV